MKLPRIFIVLLAVVIICAQADAISLQGLKASAIYGPNAHAHLSTTPIRIFTIVVTPSVNGGFAQIMEVNSASQDQSAVGSGNEGAAYISVTKTKADIQGATASNAIAVYYPEGVNVAENTFIDCWGAYVQVYYKEQ